MESQEVDTIMSAYLETLDSSGIGLSTDNRNLIVDFLAKLTDAHGTNSMETILPPIDLLTTCIPRGFHVGTGLSITNLLASQIVTAEHEVLFVTCFWASSQSRNALCSALRELNSRSRDGNPPLRIRIGFSSSGVFQKLFHTASPRGKIYPPEKWKSIGLPGPEELDCLDLEVKSVFFLPFSVLHGKFCIIDRQRLFLPSANVSWETWGECCMAFEGQLVQRFVQFWGRIWGTAEDAEDTEHPENWFKPSQPWEQPSKLPPIDGSERAYPAIFLPQPHHRNPRFWPPSFQPTLSMPITPQNAFLLSAVEHAQENIYLQTPNLTSRPLIAALVAAVQRGVAVEIVTCRRMMLLEQLVTTLGTAVTEFCVSGLSRQASRSLAGKSLTIYYYLGAAPALAGEHEMGAAVKSHVKCMLVDGEIAILGSGNADRASWWTSQEVNVAIFSDVVARCVRERLVEGLGGRLECVHGEGNLGAEPRKGVMEV